MREAHERLYSALRRRYGATLAPAAATRWLLRYMIFRHLPYVDITLLIRRHMITRRCVDMLLPRADAARRYVTRLRDALRAAC